MIISENTGCNLLGSVLQQEGIVPYLTAELLSLWVFEVGLSLGFPSASSGGRNNGFHFLATCHVLGTVLTTL